MSNTIKNANKSNHFIVQKSIWSYHDSLSSVIIPKYLHVLTCLMTVPSIVSSKLMWALPAPNTLKFVLSRFKLSLLHKNQEFKSHIQLIICFTGNIRYCFTTNKNICAISKQVKITISTTILDIVHINKKQERSKNAPLGYITVNIRYSRWYIINYQRRRRKRRINSESMQRHLPQPQYSCTWTLIEVYNSLSMWTHFYM